MQPPSQKCNHPPKNATAKASCFVALFGFLYFPFIWFKRNRSIFSRFLVCCFSLFYVLLKNKKRNDFVSIVAFRCGCGGWIWTNDLRVMRDLRRKYRWFPAYAKRLIMAVHSHFNFLYDTQHTQSDALLWGQFGVKNDSSILHYNTFEVNHTKDSAQFIFYKFIFHQTQIKCIQNIVLA